MSANNTHAFSQEISCLIFYRYATITAGNNLSHAPGRNSRKKLVSLSFLLTTDASPSDRYVHIICEKAGIDYHIGGVPIPQAASQARRFYFSPFEYPSFITSTNNFHAPIPNEFIFFYADTLETDIVGLQAGDQLTDITIIFAEQPTGRLA